MSALITEIIRSLESCTREEIEALPPAERARLADLLKHLANIAERGDEPKGGVLRDLKDNNGEH